MLPIDSAKLKFHIESERKRYGLWAFLQGHGGGGKGYYNGYLQALDDIETAIEKGKLDLGDE